MGWLGGRVAVVTGAGRGIGRSIALALAQEGAVLLVNDTGVAPDGSGPSQEPADAIAAEIRSLGGTAAASYDSVASTESGEKVVRAAVDQFGRIDILVNCAGIVRDRMIFNMTKEEWDDVIAVHLKGAFACTRPAAMFMRQQRSGRIINLTSESGLVGNAGQANYGAAKSGIAGFTRVVARDMGRYGVTCNAVAPRAWTRLTAAIPGASFSQREQVHSPLPLPDEMRGYSPEDVAPMVSYLASDESKDINGQIFLVYGGAIALLQQPVPWRTTFKAGTWTVPELTEAVPELLEDVPNPAPPAGVLGASSSHESRQ